MASIIKEGLICAECHAEFNSVAVLLSHYQNTHSPEEAKSIKALIDKAKLKLGNKQEEVIRTTAKYYDIYEEVPVGRIRTHFEQFKRIRSSQVERLSSEASKLLIRLHKILEFEGEESKRRGFEQSVVQWIDEKYVSRCPDCAESFGILLRKHHCRLCGSILCDNCSIFIDGNQAASLTSQIGKHDSLSSEYKLRTCGYCNNLVKMKGSTVDPNPLISQLYERLKLLMSECEALNSEYNRMVNSVGGGDNLYSTEQVTILRNDLIKHTEKIDLLSKRITVLGVENNEPISESENKLRSRLRTSAVNWVRDFLAGISAVPERDKPQNALGDGWTPSVENSSDLDDSNEDVINVQIRQMKKWIAEARKANRNEEVEMLETNLAELLRFGKSA